MQSLPFRILRAFGLSLGLMSAALGQEKDRVTGLIMEEGWQLVQANCTECHAAQLITQNAGSRAVWESRIRWMQDTQGLGEMASSVENEILDYLAANYGAKSSTRRANLAPHLLPANPYPKQD